MAMMRPPPVRPLGESFLSEWRYLSLRLRSEAREGCTWRDLILTGCFCLYYIKFSGQGGSAGHRGSIRSPNSRPDAERGSCWVNDGA